MIRYLLDLCTARSSKMSVCGRVCGCVCMCVWIEPRFGQPKKIGYNFFCEAYRNFFQSIINVFCSRVATIYMKHTHILSLSLSLSLFFFLNLTFTFLLLGTIYSFTTLTVLIRPSTYSSLLFFSLSLPLSIPLSVYLSFLNSWSHRTDKNCCIHRLIKCIKNQ